MPFLSLPRLPAVLALAAASLLAATPASGEAGTPEEAQVLVARAIALYDETGRQKAFAAFEDPGGGFVDGDLYVFVFGPDRAMAANGGNPGLRDMPVDTLHDPDGVPLGTMIMDMATSDGVWIDYKWPNPETEAVEPKSSWVVRHDGHVFGVGIYNP